MAFKKCGFGKKKYDNPTSNDIATDIPEVQANSAPVVEASKISAEETVNEAELEQEYRQLSLFDNDDGELPF